MFKVLLKPAAGGEPVEVEIERAGDAAADTHVGRVGPQLFELELEQLAPGDGWLRIRERVVPFHAVRDGDRVQVWINGAVYAIEAEPRGPRRAGAASTTARSSAVTAPMPGTVLKVHVAAGEAFDAHQPLVILESMKMEMTLSVPHAGRVREVLCAPGQLVELGAALVKLEDADDAART